jgi:hypothetical protein
MSAIKSPRCTHRYSGNDRDPGSRKPAGCSHRIRPMTPTGRPEARSARSRSIATRPWPPRRASPSNFRRTAAFCGRFPLAGIGSFSLQTTLCLRRDRGHIVQSDFINAPEYELTRAALIGLLLLKRPDEARRLAPRSTSWLRRRGSGLFRRLMEVGEQIQAPLRAARSLRGEVRMKNALLACMTIASLAGCSAERSGSGNPPTPICAAWAAC